MITLFQDPELAREMGLRGYDRVRAYFGAQEYIDSFEQLFYELV